MQWLPPKEQSHTHTCDMRKDTVSPSPELYSVCGAGIHKETKACRREFGSIAVAHAGTYSHDGRIQRYCGTDLKARVQIAAGHVEGAASARPIGEAPSRSADRRDAGRR